MKSVLAQLIADHLVRLEIEPPAEIIVDHPKVRSIGDLARHQADVEGFFSATLVGKERPPKLTRETHGDAASIVKAMAPVREQLAAHVDSEMKEVSRQAGAVDSVRVAVLAALNIADECFRLRAQAGEAGAKLQKRAARLAEELGTALGE